MMTHAIKLHHPKRITAGTDGDDLSDGHVCSVESFSGCCSMASSRPHAIQHIINGHPLSDEDAWHWDDSGCSPAGLAYASS
jgi:hypothetical protein